MNSEVKALRDEIARLIANDKKRQKGNDELAQTIDKQHLEISDLRKRLTYYENPHTPPSMRSLEYKRQKKEQREMKKNNNNMMAPQEAKSADGSRDMSAHHTAEKQITVWKKRSQSASAVLQT